MKNLIFELLASESTNAMRLVEELAKLPKEKQKQYENLLEKYQELLDLLREQFNKCQD